VRGRREGGTREGGERRSQEVGGVAKVPSGNNNKYKKWLSFLGAKGKPPSIGPSKFRYDMLLLGLGLNWNVVS
jgi:hypothetical protein